MIHLPHSKSSFVCVESANADTTCSERCGIVRICQTSAVLNTLQRRCTPQLHCTAKITVISVSYAAFYWARELVFTRDKLIAFTTSRELSHYVVLS